ncbi:O-antigen ligase family protein [Vibrio sp. RC27]
MYIDKKIVSYTLILFLLLLVQSVFAPKFGAVDLIELDLADEVEKLSTGSLFNQLIWPVCFISGFLLLIYSRQNFSSDHALRIKVDLFIIFAIFAFLLFGSVIADYPMTSLKRSLFFIVSMTSIGMIIMSRDDDFDIWNIYFLAFVPILVLDLVAVMFYNGIDLSDSLRGIHGQKNIAGMTYSIFTIYFYNLLFLSKARIVRVFLLCSIVMLILTMSKTSMTMTFGFILLYRLFGEDKLIKLAAFALITSTILTMLYVLSAFDVDPLLITGRGAIWEFVRTYIGNDILLGMGYGSFWGVGDNAYNVLYGEGYLSLINQAHNGYLDLMVSGGIVLLMLTTVLIFRYMQLCKILKGYRYSIISIYLVLFLVIGNITESTIFNRQSFIWIIFVVSYFTLAREYLVNGVKDDK